LIRSKFKDGKILKRVDLYIEVYRSHAFRLVTGKFTLATRILIHCREIEYIYFGHIQVTSIEN